MNAKKCKFCFKDNSKESLFCIECGARLDEPDKEDSSHSDVTDLDSNNEILSSQVKALTKDVVQLRLEVGRLRQEIVSFFKKPTGTLGHVVNPTSPVEILPGDTSSSTRRPSTDLLGKWSEQMPGNWLGRIGGFISLFALGFFLAAAVADDLIGPRAQILIGLVVGMLLMGLGEMWQRKYPPWANAVTGTGIGSLYLTIYAAVGIHELVGLIPASSLLIVVTIASVALSLRYNSAALAIIGVIGALIAPIGLEEELIIQGLNPWVVLGYILVLDIGVLSVSIFRDWRWLRILAGVGSYGLFLVYVTQEGDTVKLVEQVGLAAIFLLFLGTSLAFRVFYRKIPTNADLLQLMGNPAAYFAINVELLTPIYQDWLPLMALSMSALYALIAYGLIRVNRIHWRVSIFALAISIILLSISIPLQLSGAWITLAWATEAIALVFAGLLLKSPLVRGFGLIGFPIIFFRLFVIDQVDFEVDGDFTVIVNARFLIFVFAVIASYVSAYLYWRFRAIIAEHEKNVFYILVGFANFLSLYVISMEVITYIDNRPEVFDTASAGLLALTLIWSIYAILALIVGYVCKSRYVKLASLGLLGIVVVKLFTVDAFQLGTLYRVASFAFIGPVLMGAGFYFQKNRETIKAFLSDKE